MNGIDVTNWNIFLKAEQKQSILTNGINAIRPYVNGRKNWLFSDTSDGAEATTIVYSVMETAKANNLHLDDDIEYLLTVMPEHLADDPDAGIDDLLPWADGIQRRFARFGTRA